MSDLKGKTTISAHLCEITIKICYVPTLEWGLKVIWQTWKGQVTAFFQWIENNIQYSMRACCQISLITDLHNVPTLQSPTLQKPMGWANIRLNINYSSQNWLFTFFLSFSSVHLSICYQMKCNAHHIKSSSLTAFIWCDQYNNTDSLCLVSLCGVGGTITLQWASKNLKSPCDLEQPAYSTSLYE